METAPMYLIIEPLPSVTLGTMNSSATGPVQWNGERFIEISLPDDSLIFYDWVRDDQGRIVGVDLYLWEEHIDVLRGLHVALKGSELGGVRIMFVPGVAGLSDATQGFGELSFYRSAKGQWLIAIGTRCWLRPGDMEWLRQIAHVRDRK